MLKSKFDKVNNGENFAVPYSKEALDFFLSKGYEVYSHQAEKYIIVYDIGSLNVLGGHLDYKLFTLEKVKELMGKEKMTNSNNFRAKIEDKVDELLLAGLIADGYQCLTRESVNDIHYIFNKNVKTYKTYSINTVISSGTDYQKLSEVVKKLVEKEEERRFSGLLFRITDGVVEVYDEDDDLYVDIPESQIEMYRQMGQDFETCVLEVGCKKIDLVEVAEWYFKNK